MVQPRLECSTCSYREWNGEDSECTAKFDGLPGHPIVPNVDGFRPDWCPLIPQRVTRNEIENSLHPTIRVALQNMHLNNGEAVPDSLLGTVEPGRSTPRGDA